MGLAAVPGQLVRTRQERGVGDEHRQHGDGAQPVDGGVQVVDDVQVELDPSGAARTPPEAPYPPPPGVSIRTTSPAA